MRPFSVSPLRLINSISKAKVLDKMPVSMIDKCIWSSFSRNTKDYFIHWPGNICFMETLIKN